MKAMRDSGVSWMGQVPAHWHIRRLRYLADLISDRVSGASPSERYVGLEHIESWTGKFAAISDDMQDDAESTVTCFTANDVLFGKLRPYLAKSAVADSGGVCSSEILVYRPHGIEGEYLKHVFLLPGFIHEVNASAYGTKMPRANSDFIGRMQIPLPSKEEQAAICRLIAVETRRIDELTDLKLKLIDNLIEMKVSLGFEMATRGLESNVEIRDTSVEWLKGLPAHWSERRNMFLFRERNQPGMEGLPVLMVSLHSGVTDGSNDNEASPRMRKQMEDKSAYKLTRQGDVAYNMMRAWQGAIGAVPVDGLVSPAYVVLTPSPEINARYFELLSRSPPYKKDFERYSKGIASFRWRLYWEGFKELTTPLPPIDEQVRIVETFDEVAKGIDGLIEHVQAEIQLLRELRSGIISDAVLGRIDVSAYMPSTEPEEAAA
jgi:type I restriction enzyme S subunit